MANQLYRYVSVEIAGVTHHTAAYLRKRDNSLFIVHGAKRISVALTSVNGAAMIIPPTAALVRVLQAFIDAEVATAASGDCGNYDPEELPHMQAARAALAEYIP